MKFKPLPSQEELLTSFTYDPLTGLLVRKSTGNAMKTDTTSGHLGVRYRDNMYMIHRLIWKMTYGYDPCELDHINQDKKDNRISNLREVSRSENQRNVSVRKDNTSGVKGISFEPKKKLWRIYVNVGKQRFYKGRFKDKNKAIAALKLHREKLHGEHAFH